MSVACGKAICLARSSGSTAAVQAIWDLRGRVLLLAQVQSVLVLLLALARAAMQGQDQWQQHVVAAATLELQAAQQLQQCRP
jgi:hypothetical protein